MNEKKTEESKQDEIETAGSFPLQSLVMRCATCRYWQGDKEKAAEQFKENPISMDLFKGWPENGECGIDYEWLNIDINGNACVEKTVDANFGCVYWGA